MVVGELVQERDLIVIGGGPAGYSAAIRAAGAGMDVVLVEKKNLGGVCLNEGCIPSKVFTHSSSAYAGVKKASQFGVEAQEITFNTGKMLEWRDHVVEGLKKGVESLCKAHKIEVIEGEASFLSDDRIGVEHGHQFDTYRFKQAVVAVGSRTELPVWAEGEYVLDGKTVFGLKEVPEHLIVCGSDYIALEAAFGYRALGSKVTFLADRDTFGFDESIEKELQRIMKKRKIKFVKEARMIGTEQHDGRVQVTFETGKGREEAEGSHLYVSGVQRPLTENLGLDRAGVNVLESGHIEVDSRCRTNVPNLFAAGDITPGPALAVKALKQGKTAADNACGTPAECNLALIPKVVHSDPPVASAGLTEAEAREQGYSVKVSEAAAAGNGFAGLSGEKEGKTKIVACSETDLLLGFHSIGAGAVELISSGITALELVARDEDLAAPYYPHPSLNENWLEAAEGLNGKALHAPPAREKAGTVK
ncbi:dihydrolipoyl dehydrogenase family protein [Alteribacter natronophilus]|uniref:dihydrolipoyl dehydrogenase family protein n=1 Tax=Alteribacter natronophilus TaxID=2583810 RepID=UPI00110DBFAC|nr:FAD-dependent oxidoreductase [Alteribacter natronophilus]TMW73076.1 dihydrolipoyl dehydrogenase [Alteribacter natronophilus]